MYKKGSISVFLAISLLTLIVFIMSIYEVTRFQIQQLEANQLLMSAGNSVLAGYDSALKNEYGIFARDMDYQDIDFIYRGYGSADLLADLNIGVDKDIVNENGVNPKDLKNGASRDLNYYLSENLKSSELRNTGLSANINQSLRSKNANKYIRKEILDFTKMNLPSSSLRSLFENLDIAVKMGKTTEFTARKNKIVKKAGKMERDFGLLYYYIDGYRVDGGEFKIQLKNYVNRIYSMENYTGAASESAPEISIPRELGAYPRLNIVMVYDKFLNGFKNTSESTVGMGELSATFRPINDEYIKISDRLEEIDYEIEDIEEEIFDLEDEQSENTDDDEEDYYQDEIDELEVELSELESEKDRLEDRKDEIEEEYKSLKKELERRLDLLESGINNINQTYEIIGDISLTDNENKMNNNYAVAFSNPDNSYLENNKRVAKLCLEITKNGEEIGGDINSFLNEEESKKSDYIYGAFEGAKDSLSKISRQYGFATKKSYDRKNNLKLMGELAKKNVDIIEGVKDDNDFIYLNLYDEIGALFASENMTKTDLDYLNENLLESSIIEDILSKVKFSSESKGDINTSVARVREALVDYKVVPNLDYDGALADRSSFVNAYESMKAFYSTCNDLLSSQFTGFDTYQLPADLESLSFGEVDKFTVDTDYDKADISSYDDEGFSKMGNALANLDKLSNAGEKVLLTEYALTMFKAYPDKFISRESMSGYPLKTHAFDAEVEYILTGIRYNRLATLAVASQILAMRIPFNIAFLGINAAKRQEIISFSNMVAGWWSLGSGALVLAFIVAGIWATIESLVDVMVLSHGGKVALIKSESTWFTSLGGMTGAGFRALVSTAISKGSAVAEEVITRLPKEVKSSLDDVTKGFSEESKDVFAREIDGIYSNCDAVLDRAFNEVDIVVNEAVNQALAEKEVLAESGSIKMDLNEKEKGVLDKAMKMIEKSDIEEGDYDAYVALKDRIDEAISEDIDDYKEELKRQYSSKVDTLVGFSLEEVNKAIDDLSEEGEKASLEYFKKLEADINKELDEEFGEISHGDKTSFMLSMDYFDYLRIIGLLNTDEDLILARMIDMMDVNLTYSKTASKPASADELLFKNFAYELSLEGEFESGFAFVDIFSSPFKMHSRKVMGYE